MPHAGWVRTTVGPRLSDHISWGLLGRVFPPDVVDQAVSDSGRVQQRTRLLPSQLVVYYVMGLALFSQSSYEEVMRMLLAGREWSSGLAEPWSVPTKAALFKARARLGPEPLQLLFDRVANPMAVPTDPRSFYQSWRLMSIDSASLDVPRTPANDTAFGRPRAHDGAEHPLPQVQVVGLTETGPRAIVAAAVGGVREHRQTLAAEVLKDLPSGALILAGRGFFSYQTCVLAVAAGADLLWRLSADLELPIDERHGDGSYTSRVHPGVFGDDDSGESVPVRVMEYTQPSHDGTETAKTYRLVTTITDPTRAPASELTGLYSQRWEIESAFDELRAHHLSPRVVLRSRMPEGVRQEVYGYLCVHYAVRWLTHGYTGIWPADAFGSGPSK